jgi:hypothetical protein
MASFFERSLNTFYRLIRSASKTGENYRVKEIPSSISDNNSAEKALSPIKTGAEAIVAAGFPHPFIATATSASFKLHMLLSIRAGQIPNSSKGFSVVFKPMRLKTKTSSDEQNLPIVAGFIPMDQATFGRPHSKPIPNDFEAVQLPVRLRDILSDAANGKYHIKRINDPDKKIDILKFYSAKPDTLDYDEDDVKHNSEELVKRVNKTQIEFSIDLNQGRDPSYSLQEAKKIQPWDPKENPHWDKASLGHFTPELALLSTSPLHYELSSLTKPTYLLAPEGLYYAEPDKKVTYSDLIESDPEKIQELRLRLRGNSNLGDRLASPFTEDEKEIFNSVLGVTVDNLDKLYDVNYKLPQAKEATPLMVASIDGKPVTGDADVLCVGAPLEFLRAWGPIATKDYDTSNPIQCADLINDYIQLRAKLTQKVITVEELKSITDSIITFAKNAGIIRAHEMLLAKVVNDDAAGEIKYFMDLFQHGPESNNYFSPSNLDAPMFHLYKGLPVLTQNEDQLLDFVLNSGLLEEVFIFVSPKWDMAKWAPVIEAQIKLGLEEFIHLDTKKAYEEYCQKRDERPIPVSSVKASFFSANAIKLSEVRYLEKNPLLEENDAQEKRSGLNSPRGK